MRITGRTKNSVRALAQRLIPSKMPPIVVASMGRSGSTLVHNAICSGLAVARFGRVGYAARGLVAGYAWDLRMTRLLPGVAYKTHALADEMPDNPEVKAVFLYGSAVDAAVSVLNARKNYGEDWIREHFVHLRAKGCFNDLTKRDVLRFADQLNGWIGLSNNPVIALKYDDLWGNQKALSRYLGFPVTLPPRRDRAKKDVDQDALEEVAATYADLEARISSMPGVMVSLPNTSS